VLNATMAPVVAQVVVSDFAAAQLRAARAVSNPEGSYSDPCIAECTLGGYGLR
jgi:hypothetical protein